VRTQALLHGAEGSSSFRRFLDLSLTAPSTELWEVEALFSVD